MGGWIIVLLGVALVVVLARKTVDRETTRNLKFLAKFLAAAVGLIVLMVFLLVIIH